MQVFLIKAIQLILSLSLLVVIHELGHFLFAKAFKTRVEKFYLFFNPWFSIFKKKIGETEYGIGWIPLGGYVSISGMIDESMNTEAMKEEPKPYEFRSKKKYQRLLIMLGGVLFNFILAFIIYIGILNVWGTSYLSTNSLKYGVVVNDEARAIGFENGDKIVSIGNTPEDNFNKIIPSIAIDGVSNVQVIRNNKPTEIKITEEHIPSLLKGKILLEPRILFEFEIGKVVENSPAEKAGILPGDKILSINNSSFEFYDQMIDYAKVNAGKEVIVNIARNSETLELPLTISAEGTIGFYAKFHPEALSYLEYKTLKYSFLEAIPAGINMGIESISSYLKQLKLIFKPETKAYESLGGFISIGNIFPAVWDWSRFWTMTAFLSIMLGVMNLLPIPALDGGHVLFLLFEIVTGKKPGDKFMEYAQTLGMLILLVLVLYANGNDILKLFK